jgi:hypothetical protein
MSSSFFFVCYDEFTIFRRYRGREPKPAKPVSTAADGHCVQRGAGLQADRYVLKRQYHEMNNSFEANLNFHFLHNKAPKICLKTIRA